MTNAEWCAEAAKTHAEELGHPSAHAVRHGALDGIACDECGGVHYLVPDDVTDEQVPLIVPFPEPEGKPS